MFKKAFQQAAASEEARRTLGYVEPLSPHRRLCEACDARTKLEDFFNILLELNAHAGAGMRILRFISVVADVLVGCIFKTQARLIPGLSGIGTD
jgi:hypothetical protein